MLPERSEVTQQLRVCNRVRKGDDGEDEGDGSRRPVSYLHFPPSPLAPSTTAPPPQQHIRSRRRRYLLFTAGGGFHDSERRCVRA